MPPIEVPTDLRVIDITMELSPVLAAGLGQQGANWTPRSLLVSNPPGWCQGVLMRAMSLDEEQRVS